MAKKRFTWIKLTDNFLFNDLRIKKLRRLAGGDTFTIIYLKMMLLSKNENGIIEFEGVEKTIKEEIALKIDEDLDNVQVTINYLLSVGLLEFIDDTNNIYLPQAEEFVGTESESAERVRKYRERKNMLEAKEKKMLEEKNVETLQCNANVTEGNKNVTDVTLHSNQIQKRYNVTQM